jgi:hypothetical protein
MDTIKVPKSEDSSGASGSPDRSSDGYQPVQYKANALRAGLLLALILLMVAAATCYGGVLLLRSRTYYYLGPAAFIVTAFFLISAGVVPIAMFREGCIEEDEDKKCKADCKVLDGALDNIHDPTLRGLAKANFKQMRMFTVIALRQTSMSYYASLVAASIGLLVLTAGGAVTVGLVGTTAKVAAGSVTALGVAMSGFLSATFLRTYSMSAQQMSYYYGQPLVHCYLLHAEWLTLTLAENPKWKTDAEFWRDVIAATIKASENAQNHLLIMQEYNSSLQVNRRGQMKRNESWPRPPRADASSSTLISEGMSGSQSPPEDMA